MQAEKERKESLGFREFAKRQELKRTYTIKNLEIAGTLGMLE